MDNPVRFKKVLGWQENGEEIMGYFFLMVISLAMGILFGSTMDKEGLLFIGGFISFIWFALWLSLRNVYWVREK